MGNESLINLITKEQAALWRELRQQAINRGYQQIERLPSPPSHLNVSGTTKDHWNWNYLFNMDEISKSSHFTINEYASGFFDMLEKSKEQKREEEKLNIPADRYLEPLIMDRRDKAFFMEVNFQFTIATHGLKPTEIQMHPSKWDDMLRNIGFDILHETSRTMNYQGMKIKLNRLLAENKGKAVWQGRTRIEMPITIL
mgnify:CR=1 FL=1